jgi:capsular exopolysaccharide synthesis family protein
MTKISSPVLQELQKQMADLIMEKAAYEAQIIGAGYNLDNDPKLKQMENRLGGVREKITEEAQKLLKNNLSGLNPLDRSQRIISELFDLRTQRESLNAKEKSLKGIVDQYNQKLLSLPQKNIELIRLERDVQVNSKIYEMVKEKTEELKIRDLGNQAFIHIVDRASPPAHPVLPRTAFNLALGFLFGLFFGLGLAFARGFFEDTIRNPEDLQRLSVDVIAGVPARARPRLNWIADKSNWTLFRAKQIFPYLLLQRNGNYEISEVYRTASTKLYLSKKKTGLKSILFTSPNPSEGKSTTVANVAIAMANRGVKTLLVDSDLRGPVLDVLFLGGQRQNGLTHVLGGHIEWTAAVRETSVKGLFIMPAGAMVKNAPEILGSALMRQFHAQARKEFGLVLFDSPPVLPVADAMILASLVDGIVLVVKASKTTRIHVKKSLELLIPLNPHIIGGIINGLHQHDLTEYRAYYRSYFDSVDSRKKPA